MSNCFGLILLIAAWAGTAAAQSSPGPSTGASSPYLDATPEDGFIARTFRESRIGKNQIAAAFDPASVGCGAWGNALVFFDVRFLKHGLTVAYGGGPGPSVVKNGIVLPDQTGAGGKPQLFALKGTTAFDLMGLVSFPTCAIQIDIRKSVLKDGPWIPSKPTDGSAIKNWDAWETRLHWPNSEPRSNDLIFLFETQDDETCAQGQGFLISRRHSLLSEFDWKSAVEIVRQDGPPFSNDYILSNGNCRYELSIRQYEKDDAGRLRPVAVSPMYAAYRAPPAR